MLRRESTPYVPPGALALLLAAASSCTVCAPRPKLPPSGYFCDNDANCGEALCDFANGICSEGVVLSDLMSITQTGPVPLEVMPWGSVAGGVGLHSPGTRGLASVAAGVEATVHTSALGSAAHGLAQTWPLSELGVGPWLALESPFDELRGEGGLALAFDGTQTVSWSTWRLRVGAGYGTDRVGHLVGQLSWGPRYVGARRRRVRSGCRPIIAPASGLRAFVALRSELESPARSEVTLGIEWDPLGPGLGIDPASSR
jgi:hypothetical protein